MLWLSVCGYMLEGFVVHGDYLILDVDGKTHSLLGASDDHVRHRLTRGALGQTKAVSRIDRSDDLTAQIEQAEHAGVRQGHRCDLLIAEDLLDALDVDADEQSTDTERAIASGHQPGAPARACATSASTSSSSVTRSSITRRRITPRRLEGCAGAEGSGTTSWMRSTTSPTGPPEE